MIAAIETSGGSLNRMIAAAAGSRIRRAEGTSTVGRSQSVSNPGAVEQTSPTGEVGKSELTEAERAEVEKLKQRDTEVRRHEQAHKAAAGGFARGGPTFEFQSGPDGKRYAVGGEVSIDLSPVKGDPRATIAKMQQVRQAANAPAEPSSQDRQVAAQAAQLERQARQELAQERSASTTGAESSTSGAATSAQATPSSPAASTGQVTPNRAAQSNAARFGARFTSSPSTTAGTFIDVRI